MSYGGDPHALCFIEIFGSLTMNVNTNETMKLDTHDVAMPIPYMNKESF